VICYALRLEEAVALQQQTLARVALVALKALTLAVTVEAGGQLELLPLLVSEAVAVVALVVIPVMVVMAAARQLQT
jgi:hypothetical protein